MHFTPPPRGFVKTFLGTLRAPCLILRFAAQGRKGLARYSRKQRGSPRRHEAHEDRSHTEPLRCHVPRSSPFVLLPVIFLFSSGDFRLSNLKSETQFPRHSPIRVHSRPFAVQNLPGIRPCPTASCKSLRSLRSLRLFIPLFRPRTPNPEP